MEDQDITYLDFYFPKGHEMRGHAMVLMSLGRLVGNAQVEAIIKKNEREIRRQIK